MTKNTILSSLSSAAVLDLLGLEAKPSMRTRALTYTGLVLAGVAVGAAAALMFTPKPGRQLRADIRHGTDELGHKASAVATRAVDAAKRTVAKVKPKGTGASDDVRMSVDSVNSSSGA